MPLILCVLSLRKEKDDEGMDYQLLLKIHSSANDEPFEFRMNFIMERERHRLLINLDQMVVKSAGELIFEVYINENLLDTRTLNVLLAPNNPK